MIYVSSSWPAPKTAMTSMKLNRFFFQSLRDYVFRLKTSLNLEHHNCKQLIKLYVRLLEQYERLEQVRWKWLAFCSTHSTHFILLREQSNDG